jgi:hypothetical protein
MELHCIWHSFHHDLLKACERFSLCGCKRNAKLESLSKNSGEVICELWIQSHSTQVSTQNSETKIYPYCIEPPTGPCYIWMPCLWGTMYRLSFFLLFQCTLPLILLYLYMLARQE